LGSILMFAAMLAQRSDGSLFCSDRKLQLSVEPHECGIVASAERSELIGGNGVKFLQDLIYGCGKLVASVTFVCHTVSLNPIERRAAVLAIINRQRFSPIINRDENPDCPQGLNAKGSADGV
jgi:hypothetical protein